MKKIGAIFIIISLIVTLQVFNGLLFGSNVNLTVLPVSNACISSKSISVYNATAISGLYGWNDGISDYPSVAVDGSGNVHVVWQDSTDGEWGTDYEIMYANYTAATGWSNATAISDVYGWNDDSSIDPSIAVDGNGNVHVVWRDATDGEWGTDQEIMYANYTAAGWSNATVISDDATGWNDGSSNYPSIAIDAVGNLHVVWGDDTDGEWGTDYEIMYANYTAAGWSNATAISDVYGWNDGYSNEPDIAVDINGNLHVVWVDDTVGAWGGGPSDTEIMYANYSAAGWADAIAISEEIVGGSDDASGSPSVAVDGRGYAHVVWVDDTDGGWGTDSEIMYAAIRPDGLIWTYMLYYYWNDGASTSPSDAVDSSGNLHVVWADDTDGEWGTDYEIMYSKGGMPNVFSKATTISDVYGWNDGSSGDPSIAIDGYGNLHVVWMDDTDGEWGTDSEIMYVKISKSEERLPIELLLLALSLPQPGLIELLPFILVGIGVVVLVVIIVVVKKRQ